MLVEHARNLIGITDASNTEYGGTGTHVINALACSLTTSEIEVQLSPASELASIHGTISTTERTNCNYGLNPEY